MQGMLDQAVAIYSVCDEVVGGLSLSDDPQCKMTSAEVMTFAVLAAKLFYGDYKRTHLIARYHKYFSNILSLSQLVRRIHNIPEHAWAMVFQAIRVFLSNHNQDTFIVDSMPIKAYENYKSFRARIFSGSKFHGYTATRKQYFFGIKVHMIVDADGVPVEFGFSPASTADIEGLRQLPIHLPEGSRLYADKAYLDYEFEEMLSEIADIQLIAKRKKNLLRQHSARDEFFLRCYRNRVETVFSSISSRMPRHIKARTERGFCLKVVFFILAYMFHKFSKQL